MGRTAVWTCGLERIGERLRLHGMKRYCTGASFFDAALVTAGAEDGLYRLICASTGRDFGPRLTGPLRRSWILQLRL